MLFNTIARTALVAFVRRTLIGGIAGQDDVFEARTARLSLVVDADAAQRPDALVGYLNGVDTDCLTLADLRELHTLFSSPQIAELLARMEAEQVTIADAA
jgi:hypothetical protein